MDNTGEFEIRMKSLDDKMARLMERTQVELELTMLQEEIDRLRKQNNACVEKIEQHVDYKRLPKPTLKRHQPSQEDRERRGGYEYRNPIQGREYDLATEAWSSPIPGIQTSPDDNTNIDPYRFVTERRGHPKHPMSSTPKAEDQGKRHSDARMKASAGAKMKPATYDGLGSWIDYKAHFEVCAALNGWSEKEKGMYLAVSLRGQAQGVYGNLGPGANTTDYTELVRALEERFSPPNQTELYRVQLRERKQKASESLSELGQDIRRLTYLAYPTAPTDVRETLAKEQFIDALVCSDIRLRIKQARPLSLNDAVRHAVELEAYNRAERTLWKCKGSC